MSFFPQELFDSTSPSFTRVFVACLRRNCGQKAENGIRGFPATFFGNPAGAAALACK